MIKTKNNMAAIKKIFHKEIRKKLTLFNSQMFSIFIKKYTKL